MDRTNDEHTENDSSAGTELPPLFPPYFISED